MSKKFYILVLVAVLSISTSVWSSQGVFRECSEEIALYGVNQVTRTVRSRFFPVVPHAQAQTSCVRRFLTREYTPFSSILLQRRGCSSFAGGRYMRLPPTPEWMFSRSQSSEKSPIDLESASKNWTQHYNPVDDVFYYQSEPEGHFGRDDEVYVSQNPIEKVNTRGAGLVTQSLPYCSTGRVRSSFSFNGTQIVGTGTAVAIDTFIALSVAHNFLPQSLGGQQNVHKHRAETATFGLQHDFPSKGITFSISKYQLHPRWEQSFDPSFDVAVLLLSPASMSYNGKYVKPYLLAHDQLLGKDISIVGYPAVIPGIPKALQGESMYVSNGQVIDCCGKQVHYNANTYGGNSGGPIVLGKNEDSQLVGLHTRGNQAAMRNSGVQLRGELETFILETIEAFYKPHNFEEEIKGLVASQYSDLSLDDGAWNFIHTLQNKKQAQAFLDLLKANKV